MIGLSFASARVRPDYKFTFGNIDSDKITPEIFRKVMVSRDMTPVVKNDWGYLHGDGDALCMATLQVGHVDAELFLMYYVEYPGGPEEQNPCIDIFVNTESERSWLPDDWIGDPINIDWRLDNWLELLEYEMFRLLMNRCEFMNYSIDEYNEDW